jgi:acyl phosphate:glycerol-3-phosphate acyltransferase
MIDYLFPLAAYFIGSVSSAIVVSRLLGLKDPRQVGSGNPGATNILRYGGKKAAIITLAGDILKGVVPVLAARLYGVEPVILALVVFMAFVGHLFPVFHGFHGGKGVATAFGVLVALNAWVGLALVVTWMSVAFLFRYSSLAGLAAAVAAPLYVGWLQGGLPFVVVTLIMAVLLVWRHRSNVQKLLAGTEGKIGRG